MKDSDMKNNRKPNFEWPIEIMEELNSWKHGNEAGLSKGYKNKMQYRSATQIRKI